MTQLVENNGKLGAINPIIFFTQTNDLKLLLFTGEWNCFLFKYVLFQKKIKSREPNTSSLNFQYWVPKHVRNINHVHYFALGVSMLKLERDTEDQHSFLSKQLSPWQIPNFYKTYSQNFAQFNERLKNQKQRQVPTTSWKGASNPETEVSHPV